MQKKEHIPNQKLKADKNKLRMDLIPPEAIEILAEILTFGANKYGSNKWQGVESERYEAALLRHYTAYKKDKHSKDEESGMKHVNHMLCNAMFLACMEG